MTRLLCVLTMCVVLCSGCSWFTPGQMGNAMTTLNQVANTAPALAVQLDDVYKFLIAQKLVPNNQVAATKALAALDMIAPIVKDNTTELKGDKFNWVQFSISAAITIAKVLGYVAPLLL